MNILQRIEHTLLKPDAGQGQIETLCNEAVEYDFRAVCVNGVHVAYAKRCLEKHHPIVVATAGFPLGASVTKIKTQEAAAACEAGADEVDMVMRIDALLALQYKTVYEDIASVVKTIAPIPVKVILETCFLTEEQIVDACKLSESAGAMFVKTSTGLNGPGATAEHVTIMRKSVGDSIKVKAAGGIRMLRQAHQMVKAGANTIGCSSSVFIAKEFLAMKK